jgi:hypothetical protein
MGSVTSRRLAAGVVVACVGIFGGAATAHAAGGLAVTPSVLEHRATVGAVGSLTLNNTTNEPLKVTIRVRPWIQQLNGDVFTDPRATLSRYVRPSASSFTLAAGAKRPISLRMLHRTTSGSLYGNVDILGKPVNTKGRRGIIPNYRLVSSLRLHPARQNVRLRTGAAQLLKGTVVLPVRNVGNTIEPVTGTYRITGPVARTGAFAAIRILPTKLVTLGLGATNGLKKGRYTINATLVQAGKRTSARTSFTIS